jgi:hypothetical protein
LPPPLLADVPSRDAGPLIVQENARSAGVIVAFLQNQWFKEPDKIRAMYARNPEKREALNKRFLFYKSLTGKRLKLAFGEELCNSIIWEECSREIGGKSSASFPADLDHMRAVIEKHQPSLMLAFGGIAREAVPKVWTGQWVGYSHPAARFITNESVSTWKRNLDQALAGVEPPCAMNRSFFGKTQGESK